MGAGYAKRARQQAEWQNNVAFQHYFNMLFNLCVSCFEWENLPDTVDQRYLETTLCRDGQIAFFRDEVIGDIVMKFVCESPLDIYNNPRTVRAYSHTGYSRVMENFEYVPIYNNQNRTPMILDIEWYAKKLAEIERTIEINANAQKTPFMLMADQQNRLSLENAFQQYNGNAPLILLNKSFDLESIKVMNLEAPYVCGELEDLKHQIMNEALTTLGIDNANMDKRERLIATEVISNLGNVEAMRYVRLVARREAADKINKMFGLNIKVDFRETTPSIIAPAYKQYAEAFGNDESDGDEDE